MGLSFPLLEYEIRENLRQKLPPHASTNNPLDILGDADETRYKLALEAGFNSQKIDAIITIVTPQAMTQGEKIAEVVIETRKNSNKPIIGLFMGFDSDSKTLKILRKNKIPNYSFPESAAHVLRRMCDYGAYVIKKDPEEIDLFKGDDKKVKKIISKVRQEGRLNLTIDESIIIAEAYGISMPKAFISKTRKEAGKFADKVGYPVVMKVLSPDILHKTDIGGVLLNLKTRQEVEKNFDWMLSNLSSTFPSALISGILIQKMIPQGKEVIVGAIRDPNFGPLIMFGLGGIYVNFLRDVSYRLLPINRLEARKMIEETKAFTLLRGVRGENPSDIESVIEVVIRISQIMSRFKDIFDMEVNPLFVYGQKKGCIAVDIRMAINKKT
jgi:acetyltransferase